MLNDRPKVTVLGLVAAGGAYLLAVGGPITQPLALGRRQFPEIVAQLLAPLDRHALEADEIFADARLIVR